MSIHVWGVKAGVSGVLTIEYVESLCPQASILLGAVLQAWEEPGITTPPWGFPRSSLTEPAGVTFHEVDMKNRTWRSEGTIRRSLLTKCFVFPKGVSSSSSNLPALLWFWFRTHVYPLGIHYLDSSSILPYTSPLSLTATLSSLLKWGLPVSEPLPSCSEITGHPPQLLLDTKLLE